MSAHEIEAWIRDHDRDLSREIRAKCYDYTRMILSLSPVSVICKYRAASTLPGVDARAAFYGLARERYPAIWTLTSKMPKSKTSPNLSRPSPETRQRQIAPQPFQSSIFAPPQPPPVAVPTAHPQEATDPWPATNPFSERNDIVWVSGVNGADSGRSDLASGLIPGNDSVVPANARPQQPMFFNDVVTVLNKDGVRKHDTLWFTDILDNIT
jgi:hypothetical protein